MRRLTKQWANPLYSRSIRAMNISETLKPVPGQGGKQLSVLNEVSINPEYEDERMRPFFRDEVIPKMKEHSQLASLYRWGFDSLSLWYGINEDPGPWWNLNNTQHISNWTYIGDNAAANLWSNIGVYGAGVSFYNERPVSNMRHAFGRRDGNGAIHFDYEETLKEEPQKLLFAHTPEHQKHNRIKNPELIGFKTPDSLHLKRVMREATYHIGHGMRIHMVDGVLGSYPLSSTPYRVWTDNGTHAYFLSMMAVRNQNIAAFEEVLLHKRVGELGLEEFAWRRPGVVVYHCPGYDFDLPRVVEEFGGPRPHDLSLSHPKAILVDPYSIPMKATILAHPKCAALQDVVAFLSARWGYYADEKEFLTLPSDSLLTSDGKWLTLIVDASGELDMNAVRASSWLYGARHHRIANGFVARCWDVTSFASHTCESRASDFVETSYNTVHRPLPPRVGDICSQSHRFHHRRFVAEFGYKREHNYPGTSSTANLFNMEGETTGIHVQQLSQRQQ